MMWNEHRRARGGAENAVVAGVGNALTIYDSRNSHVVRQFAKRLEANLVKYVELE